MVYDQPRTGIQRAELHRPDRHLREGYCVSGMNQYPLLNLLRWSSRMHSIARPPGGIWPRPPGKCQNHLQTARKISPSDYLVLMSEYAGSSEEQSQEHLLGALSGPDLMLKPPMPPNLKKKAPRPTTAVCLAP